MRHVAPTKTSLLKIKDELNFARLGHELLDQKRNILVIELLNIMDEADEYETRIEKNLERGFGALERASMDMGKLRIQHVKNGINIEVKANVRQRRVMGVRLPLVETSFYDNPPYFSPMETSFWLDRAIIEFKKALKDMGRLAELKISIMRLAREVKKTIRKVNALEKIAIPDLNETLEYIQNRLEENEREMFVLMKMVKNRLEKKKEKQNE